MTKELLEKAQDLDHDICVLEDIKFEQDNQRRVEFIFPGDFKIEGFKSSEIIEDFREFIRFEVEKAREMFKELGEEE